MRRLTACEQVFPLANPFTISRGTYTTSPVVEAVIEAEGFIGRGESFPYPHYGESMESVIAEIDRIADAVAQGAGRQELQSLLPPGAARNAVDCAFWDLSLIHI